MRLLIAALLLAGCGEESSVEVTLVPPEGASLPDLRVRISAGLENREGVFDTLVGIGAEAQDAVFLLEVPEGRNRLMRAVIHDDDFRAVLHGQSEAFDVEGRTAIEVPLQLPPEGFITSARLQGNQVRLELQARRWAKIQLGLDPEEPTHEAEREGGPAGDQLEGIAIDYPLEMFECDNQGGCPLTLFVDFLAEDGVAGPTATATLSADLLAPALVTRARIAGAMRLGGGSQLVVQVDATEPVTEVELTLDETLHREGSCSGTLGPFACQGSGSSYLCRASAPQEPCDANFAVEITAVDAAGNQGSVRGAEVGVDTLPPQLVLSEVSCDAGLLWVSGQAGEAERVELRDAEDRALIWSEDATFVLVASSSAAVSIAAIDGGGNEATDALQCP